MGSLYPVLQLCILAVISYGIFLITYHNDRRTSKEKKTEIQIGIVLVSVGSFVILSIWIIYFLNYKKSLSF